jgi:neuroligin
MYVFNHNSEAGDHAGIDKSIHGEDLPYIFGAPLGGISPSPFHTTYNSEEQLLSKAIMKYFTNFARSGRPTEIQRSFYSSRHRDSYDVDWQEFNEINQNYLLLGIPPVLSSRYRHNYVKFWNEGLLDTMKNYNNFNNNQHQQMGGIYGKTVLEPSSATIRGPYIEIGYPIKGEMGFKSPKKDPIRELFHLQQQPRDSSSHSHYTSTFSHQHNNEQSSNYNNKNVMMITTTTLTSTDQPIIHQQISSGDEEIFKSETTAFLLIAVIVTFLVVNIVGLGIYLYRRGKKLNRKYDNTNLYDTTTSNDDKRSKYNDTDESFILRKSNNTYESVKRHSPINGFGIRRQISSSTVDTHAKVIGWMSTDEENKKRAQNSTFSTLKREKVSVAIDATPQARSNSILRQEPIEITKAKSSFDYGNRIVCQDVEMDITMIDEIPFREFREMTESGSSSCSSCSHCSECALNRQLSYGHDEEVTSFIEPSTPFDVNVTSREEYEKVPLSPEESLRNIQRMNCPKVLPNYPENHQFSDSRRRSLQIPSQYYQIHQNPPEQSEKQTLTLGRKPTLRSEPIKVEEPPPQVIPEITSTSITIGPLIPKPENIYMSMQRRKSLSRQNSTNVDQQQSHNKAISQIETEDNHDEIKENHDFDDANARVNNENLYSEIIKNSRVQQPQDGIYSITTTNRNSKKLHATNSLESNSSASSSSEQSSTGTVKEMN